jgi:hypothetical protein
LYFRFHSGSSDYWGNLFSSAPGSWILDYCMMETTRIRTGGGGTLRGAVLVLLAAWIQLGVLPVRAAIESMDDVVASCEIQGSSVPSQSEVSSFCSMVRWTSASLYPADNYTVRFLTFQLRLVHPHCLACDAEL